MTAALSQELSPSKTLAIISELLGDHQRVHAKVNGVIHTLERNPTEKGGGFIASYIENIAGNGDSWSGSYGIRATGEMAFGSTSRIEALSSRQSSGPGSKQGLDELLMGMQRAGVSPSLDQVRAS